MAKHGPKPDAAASKAFALAQRATRLSAADQTVLDLWRERIVLHATQLDGEHDKGGHDWFSLWCGFVIGMGYEDWADAEHYRRIGFPAEKDAV